LYLDDVLEALRKPKPLYEEAERNKHLYQEAMSLKPTASLGRSKMLLPDPFLERVFGLSRDRLEPTNGTLSGIAASAGTYTGTVKIVRGQEDFAKLQRGDILVCPTMTPPWTVLFPIAGALVTDAGGILSHAASVAREYRLPAVVGTSRATSMLKDGDRAIVDGTKGTVYFSF
jgi:rifampicin phosphotransferase